jgi:hypothetical protein
MVVDVRVNKGELKLWEDSKVPEKGVHVQFSTPVRKIKLGEDGFTILIHHNTLHPGYIPGPAIPLTNLYRLFTLGTTISEDAGKKHLLVANDHHEDVIQNTGGIGPAQGWANKWRISADGNINKRRAGKKKTR